MARNPGDPVAQAHGEWEDALQSVLRLDKARRNLVDGDVVAMQSDVSGKEPDAGATEIERASAALRRGQPDLDALDPTPAGEPGAGGKPRSVWLAIGAVWVLTMAILVAAGAAVAALFL